MNDVFYLARWQRLRRCGKGCTLLSRNQGLWNRKEECSVLTWLGLYFDATSVPLHDSFAGGQAEAHTAAWRSGATNLMERFENPFRIFCSDPDAVVLHRE